MFFKPMYAGHKMGASSQEVKRGLFTPPVMYQSTFASFSLPGPLTAVQTSNMEKKNAQALESLQVKLSIIEKGLTETVQELEVQLNRNAQDASIKAALTIECEALKFEIAQLAQSVEDKEMDLVSAKLRISELEQTIADKAIIEEEANRTIASLRDEIQTLANKLTDAHEAVRKLVLNRTPRLEIENVPTDGNQSGPETELRSAKNAPRVKAEIAPPAVLPVKDWTSRLGCLGF